jgi:hypothetical protein
MPSAAKLTIMKTTTTIIIFLLILLTSCKNDTQRRTNYLETKTSFFELRNQNWLRNKWIRKSENLIAVHETFKKFGYKNLISENLIFDNPMIIQDIYINRRATDLLDSLELTYEDKNIKTKYYREFWNRRKMEKNDIAAYKIIKEINSEISGKDIPEKNIESKNVNDTLFNLINIEFKKQRLNEEIALKNFEYLRNIGMNQSAYNLLFERHEYENIKWNRDSLMKTLKTSTEFTPPWFDDNSK